ncbi:erythromycin resistance leader peptide [Oceanobacillus caeni]|nr:erythromycin resistance leader peptide [Oceanobacillus caeni]
MTHSMRLCFPTLN